MAESFGRSENACERFFWALQGVNYNVYGIVSASGDLVERYEYTPYGRRTVYSRGWLRWDMTGDGVVDSADYDIYLRDRFKRGDEASAADINGDGWVNGDEDHWEDFFEWYAGQSVADDPLVMHSRLESFRTDSRFSSTGGYGSLCDIGHQGLLHDKEFGPAGTGLVHNRARTLNPPLARFNQRDPLGYPDGMNGYEYVRSEPTQASDPNGTWADKKWILVNQFASMKNGRRGSIYTYRKCWGKWYHTYSDAYRRNNCRFKSVFRYSEAPAEKIKQPRVEGALLRWTGGACHTYWDCLGGCIDEVNTAAAPVLYPTTLASAGVAAMGAPLGKGASIIGCPDKTAAFTVLVQKLNATRFPGLMKALGSIKKVRMIGRVMGKGGAYVAIGIGLFEAGVEIYCAKHCLDKRH